MSHTPEHQTFAPVRLAETARAMVSGDMNAPVLHCTACLRECDTFGDEVTREATANAILALFEHTLYEHATRAAIQESRVTRIIRWEA